MENLKVHKYRIYIGNAIYNNLNWKVITFTDIT